MTENWPLWYDHISGFLFCPITQKAANYITYRGSNNNCAKYQRCLTGGKAGSSTNHRMKKEPMITQGIDPARPCRIATWIVGILNTVSISELSFVARSARFSCVPSFQVLRHREPVRPQKQDNKTESTLAAPRIIKPQRQPWG